MKKGTRYMNILLHLIKRSLITVKVHILLYYLYGFDVFGYAFHNFVDDKSDIPNI